MLKVNILGEESKKKKVIFFVCDVCLLEFVDFFGLYCI